MEGRGGGGGGGDWGGGEEGGSPTNVWEPARGSEKREGNQAEAGGQERAK